MDKLEFESKLEYPERLNLPLRTWVLYTSLSLEDSLTSLIRIYVSVHGDAQKALANKSGNLTSKNRIDLLFDLEIFDETDWKTFNLFFEFRNQFIHNHICATFSDAVTLLGVSRGNKLLGYLEDRTGRPEADYEAGFEKLFGRCLEILKEKIAAKKEYAERSMEILKAALDTNRAISLAYLEFVERLSLALQETQIRHPNSDKLVTELRDTIFSDFNATRSSVQDLERMLSQRITIENLDIILSGRSTSFARKASEALNVGASEGSE